MSSFPLPSIPLISNLLVNKDDSARVWIYYIGIRNANSDAKTSRRTIESISNKSFGLVCWLNNKNIRVWN